MSKTPHRHPDDPEQSRRFIEMAREHEAEGDSEKLARAVKKVAALPREKVPAKKAKK